MQGVLSRRTFKPPLRNAKVTVRYSPDGRSLLIQNPSGIFLLSRQPLVLTAHFSAENLYSSQFSSDSQSLTVVGFGLQMYRQKVPSGANLEQMELPFDNGCIDARLSPGGDYFACLFPDYKLIVYQLSTKQVIFSESLDSTGSSFRVVLEPLGHYDAFAGPFGFHRANDWQDLAGKDRFVLPMSFSPDGKLLLVNTGLEAFGIDLATGRKKTLRGELHKQLKGSFCMLDDDRLLLARDEKDSRPVLVSLKTGDVLAHPAFTAGSVRPASDSRYVILADAGVAGERIFDLQENRELDAPDNVAVDIFNNELAALNSNGTLFLYHPGEKLPFASADLPPDELPNLLAAVVSPALDRFAFSVQGNGAVYDVTNGQMLSSTPPFSAPAFSDSSTLYFLPPSLKHDVASPVSRLTLPSGKPQPAWQGEKELRDAQGGILFHSGGTVLFQYAFETKSGHPIISAQESSVDYRLRALDQATGKELWRRDFSDHSPVPFADPQGDRLVLAWDASNASAEAAAKRIPTAWPIFKHAKRSNLDTFFEVVDCHSGASIAGVLLQQGSGPYSFDAAFSVGDALFLVKDEKRVSLYSLRDGKLLGKFVGLFTAASAESGLFALEETLGRVSFYDLATGTKLGQHNFMDPIAYIHFSSDGSRIFVLTKQQVAYVLDATFFRSKGAPTALNEHR
ncbi:MAG: hypothetical protein WA798_09410 [Candidatus Acidiferrum sp.]